MTLAFERTRTIDIRCNQGPITARTSEARQMEDNEDKKQQTQQTASAAEDPVRAQNEALARPGAYKTNSIAAYTPAGVINAIISGASRLGTAR